MSTQTNTVLITGASSGIGLDIARGFLEKGSNVVLNARNGEKLAAAAQTLGEENRTALVPGDIGDRETGKKMVDVAVAQFGSVDVLVNNAGIFGLKPFLESTEEDLDQYIHINLKGTYFVTQGSCPANENTEGWKRHQYRHRAADAFNGRYPCKRRFGHESYDARLDHQPIQRAGSRQHPGERCCSRYC